MSDHPLAQPADTLKNYLVAVCKLTAAANASLYVPATDADGVELLLHECGRAAIPELLDTAVAAHSAAALQARESPTAVNRLGDFVEVFTSADPQASLLKIHLSAVDPMFRAQPPRTSLQLPAPVAWLGLKFNGQPPPQLTTAAEASAGQWIGWSIASGFHFAWNQLRAANLQQDPVSLLPGRDEFQVQLKATMATARKSGQLFGLALLNPDDFGLINNRLGREQGDRALRELGAQLCSALRDTDSLFRYGGAVFGLILQMSSREEAQAAAERIRQTLAKQALIDGAIRLGISVGLAIFNGEQDSDVSVDDLIRRADRALNTAKLSGGSQTVVWESSSQLSMIQNFDRLSGIFTADTAKDYRNMQLLWDMVAVISSQANTAAMAQDFVDRLCVTFKPRQVALCLLGENDEFQVQAFALNAPGRQAPGQGKVRALKLSEKRRVLLQRASQSLRPERGRLAPDSGPVDPGNTFLAYAIPLLVENKTSLGCIYIDGQEPAFTLGSSDIIFLAALANQMAVALDRVRLGEKLRQSKEQESRQLKVEVRGLRNALQQSRMVYRSPQMQAVLDVVRRIAPTDVTVLVTGESGTGKEVLARTIHEQSKRKQQAFVTVDCGAIPQSLIDAELFGHVKGAYTGAQEASKGRIAQAEGGTLFLDEIGELPLEVQTKLLRFVQEREFTAVGATHSRQIDVRIVAATNRDLALESQAGRFRQDLYYRLQVVTLTSPPLRQRLDDILPLAYYFLEKFAVQNGSSARSLSPEAEAKLLQHNWPGNVRELQNRVLQAVIMSDAEEIDLPDLAPATGAPVTALSGVLPEPAAALPTRMPAAAAVVPPAKQLDRSSDPWGAIEQGLAQQVQMAMSQLNGKAWPLGRWLLADLVAAADDASAGNARQAAQILGMAETTFRRQLEKVRQEEAAGLLVRAPGWADFQPLLQQLVSAVRGSPGEDVIDRASQLLLQHVLGRVGENDKLGSALLGVTRPTYLRRKSLLDYA